MKTQNQKLTNSPAEQKPGKHISAFTNDAMGTMDAVSIAEAIAKKEVSAEEITLAAIARAEKVNPQLNAIIIKTYDDALGRCKNLAVGMLKGVPSFVKDNDSIKGYPTQLGTGAFKAPTAKKDAGFVKQFTSTGLNVIGKTSLPEFGLICSTENDRWGITRNPWNPDYTTGGSSSGSAAMVASGVVPIATANDGAGSIRIPAGCCGLVGLKPTRKRLKYMDGTNMLPLQIVHEGVLTRTVRDTAAFYASAEKYYYNPQLPEMGYIKNPSEKKLRIVFFENVQPGKIGHQDDDTYRVQNETAKLLQGNGHHVEQIPLFVDIDFMSDHFLNYYGFLAYMMSYYGRMVVQAKVDKSQLEPFTIGLADRFRNHKINTLKSMKLLHKISKESERIFKKYDLIMLPVTSHKTPELGYFSPHLSYEEITRRAVVYASYTALQNVSGSPALSLPLGTDSNNMPLGVHFGAPYGQEKRLIELAYELEEARPWKYIFNMM